MSIKGNMTTLVAVLALCAAGYWMYNKRTHTNTAAGPKTETKAASVPAVTVVKVATSEFVETTFVSGSLVAREEILVSPEIEGLRVLELKVDEGDRVTKGQVLATLVTEQLDAQLAQNAANIARAAAAIEQAKSQIVQAEAQEKEATNQLERAEPLKKSGYLSGSTYDQRESAARTAQAAVVAARDGLTAAEAERTQFEAARRELDWRRGNTEVRAPADGIISKRNARIGAMATAVGEPMFRIIQKGEIELDAEVVETELPSIKVGQKAIVTVPGAADVEGTVRLISPEVDKATRLGRVRIFLGENASLRVGAYARGRIETARSRGLGVPTASVNFDTSGATVQVVNGDRIETRVIKTGLTSGDRVEVRQGLAEGDTIVARAGTFLRDGDTVRPIIPAAALSEAR